MPEVSNTTQEQTAKTISAKVTTIPDIFYGGVDPKVVFTPQVVKPKEEKKSEKIEITPKVETKVETKKVASSNAKLVQPKQRKKSKFPLLILLVIVLAGFSYGAYYVYNLFTTPQTEEPPVINTEPPVQVPPTKTPVTPTTTPTSTPNEIEEPVSLQEEPLYFTPTNLQDPVDMDGDGLSSFEEDIFSTDSGIFDSDQDQYDDGLEVVNLYNPNGFAPVKIIDSGLVREYINPNWQYRFYYPTVWKVDSVDPDSNQVIATGATGEYIEIRVVEKPIIQPFLSWFGEKAEDQNFADLGQIVNRFSQDGYKRRDNLVAYFVQDNYVYVIAYHPNENAQIVNYRTVMEMLIQSFRPSESSENRILQTEEKLNTENTTSTESISKTLEDVDNFVGA